MDAVRCKISFVTIMLEVFQSFQCRFYVYSLTADCTLLVEFIHQGFAGRLLDGTPGQVLGDTDHSRVWPAGLHSHRAGRGSHPWVMRLQRALHVSMERTLGPLPR